MKQTSFRSARIVAVAAAGIMLTACGGSRPEEPSAPPPARAEPTARPAPAQRQVPATDEAAARRELARKRAILEERVFFDYDRSEIRGDAMRTLDAKIPILREDASIRLLIEGHADDRGSTEYNLALGSRRANAILEYMAGYGISANRLEVTSFGEARPLQQGSNEAAWGRNRRGEFVIRQGLATR